MRNSCLSAIVGCVLFVVMLSFKTAGHADVHHQENPELLGADSGRIFIINAPVKDIKEFAFLVQQVRILKSYGKVKVNISTLADKAFHEIPKTGSPWHEYASSNPSPFKFFPDPKLAPFLPAAFVKKNRDLLLAKAKILRENGLEAAFIGYEPNFLPAAFFEAYPAMMGARVDHPRRSNQKEFAPCICSKETQLMYANMMAELLRNVPEITTFSFKTNDAGAGICWSDWLYTGPNGDISCRKYSTGERVKMLLGAFKEGASKEHHSLSIYLDEGNSNFSAEEKKQIEINLPEDCYFSSTGYREIDALGSMFNACYPVTGLLNPIAFLNQSVSAARYPNNTIFINFRAAYDRGLEKPDMTEMVLALTASAMKNPGKGGTISNMESLQSLCESWGGKKYANSLFNAFVNLNEALTYKASVFPRVSSLYWGVTARLINRPLVINPARLRKEEESYFLPYIFNISEQEARNDYVDIHGSRGAIPPGAVENYISRINRVASVLESLDQSAPKRDFLIQMAMALRIHASIIRSCGNFAAAQVIRDRDSIELTSLPKLPSKESTWTGHADFMAFNNIMRDELDNTRELIELLEKGGLNILIFAKDPVYEDRFLLGPDIINQLKKKRKVMLDHWSDIEGYLASPYK